jgi:hypothetical protein
VDGWAASASLLLFPRTRRRRIGDPSQQFERKRAARGIARDRHVSEPAVDDALVRGPHVFYCGREWMLRS